MSKSRYKTERILYPNRWQPTEDLIADGYYYAQKKPSETIEIAAHIMAAARVNDDDELFNVGLDLMRVANSPCIFQPDNSAESATDNNNRPSVPVVPAIPEDLLNDGEEDFDIEEWNSQYDGIFNSDLNPQKIFKKLEKLSYPRITDDYPRFFVFFNVLVYLGWIDNHQKNFLKWANCHWKRNWVADHRFKFGNNIQKELRDTPMGDWTDKTCNGSDVGVAYRCFAINVMSKFTDKVNGNMIIDIIVFYKADAKHRINDGKNLVYPF